MPIHSRTFIPTQMPTENIMPQSDSLLSDVEFERLKADILSDDPISGPVIHSCPPTQSPIQQFPHQMPSNSSASPHWQNISEPCYPQQQRMPLMSPRIPSSNASHQQMMIQTVPVNQMGISNVRMAPNVQQTHGMLSNQSQVMPPVRQQLISLPPPPTPPAEPMNDHERQQQSQYESWLIQQNNVLAQQQKYYETEVGKLRKAKKTLNAKQRQCRKNQNELSEHDANELTRITQEQNGLQKHLDQVRKTSRHHQMLISEYKQKQHKRQGIVGVSQTPISLPQSPGTSSLSSISGQGMQASPRSVHSPLMALGSSAPGTPIAMGGPGTPQSPAIMSPSPMGPSPSPLMQNSPAPNLHSPAAMPPSPMVQSPMPPPMPTDVVRPQMSAQSVHIVQDDNNPFSDVYQQKEKMQMRQNIQTIQTPTSVSFSHMMSSDIQQVDDRPKMFRQVSFHNEEQIQFHHSVPHMPSHQNPLAQQTRPQIHPQMQTQHTSHYQQSSNESAMFRFPNQHHNHPQRSYTELVGQPYPAQLPPNYQQQQQQQQQPSQQSLQQMQLVRRPPPPPYPGSLGPPMQQQQHMRMYGSPQVAQMSRLPLHQMHPRMTDFSSRSPFDDSNAYVENVAQPNFPVNPDEHSMIQCSPRPMPISSYSLSDDNTIHLPAVPDLSSVDSQDLLDTNANAELLADLESQYKSQTENENDLNDKKSLVGEAKTSLTFNIDEQGSGQDNDAVNDAIMTNNDSNKECENQHESNSEVKIKQELIESTSNCSQPNQWLIENNETEIKNEVLQVLYFFNKFLSSIFILY
jgi:hypothetical protein